MSDDHPLIKTGDIPLIKIDDVAGLSKPATRLIDKISEAVVGLFRPFQIRRVAEAEADAARIQAAADIEITDLQRRAMYRFFGEEAKKQENMEQITQKAIPDLREDSRPQDVEDDWITNFFDRGRLISDTQMQMLWAKVLSGQCNSPGIFSKRTVDLLASFDKADAELFNTLCGFCWRVNADIVPLVYDLAEPIYTSGGLSFPAIKHLDDIGLIRFENLSGYKMEWQRRALSLHTATNPYLSTLTKNRATAWTWATCCCPRPVANWRP